jgi:hypothetical protein
MRRLHETLLAEVALERRRLSRRGMLSGSMKVAGGGLLVLSLGSVPLAARAQDDDAPFADDVEVLNYALTLELLENAFYRDGLPAVGDLGTDGFGFSVSEQLAAIGAHEAAHVQTLTDVVASLGGTPVAEGPTTSRTRSPRPRRSWRPRRRWRTPASRPTTGPASTSPTRGC